MTTAEEVSLAVRRHYGVLTGPDRWSALPEFAFGPGGGVQRIDLLMVRNWRGRNRRHERHAIEIKVSRGDLLAELAQPSKRAPFERIAHAFYFAVPAGLMRDGELPDGCGLLEVTDRGVRRTKLARVNDDPADPPSGWFVEAARRASRAEHRLASDPGDGAELARLRLENASLQSKLEGNRMTLARERDRSRAMVRRLLDAAGTLYCLRCGRPLKAKSPGIWNFKHADGDQADCPCPMPDEARLTGALEIPETTEERW